MFSLFNENMELLAIGHYAELVTFARVELLKLFVIVPNLGV